MSEPALAEDFAIIGARIYTDPQAKALDDGVVIIRDGRIAAVGQRGKVAVPQGLEVVSGTGRTLVAGFWNSHVHLMTHDLLHPKVAEPAKLEGQLRDMFTRWGFTTVFDLTSSTASATTLRRMIAERRIAGPQILTVGDPFFPKDGTPVYARPVYEAEHIAIPEIRSTPEAVARLDRQAEAGVDGVKLFTGAILGAEEVMVMPADEIRALTAEAHRHRLPVFAHPTNNEGMNAAVENGVDVLAHATPIAGPWDAAQVRKLVVAHVALVPTMMLFEVYPSDSTPVATVVQQVRALSEGGGEVLFGTDAGFMDVFDPSAEYRLLGQAMDWRHVLTTLTTAPARRFGQSHERGRIVPGQAADMVLLDGDPALDVTTFSKVALTIRAGEILSSIE
ncbi:amidohydrolase family protein [Novosphingobium sp. PhB165]|uniref:amidohydrolase family protein n=1 Tax=Novosphingobium sp. PhB165 TaxID=2485105 RepID=UPI00140490D9|nr:amidohydrolase family protein [Novosphingobium sp. PhB165]